MTSPRCLYSVKLRFNPNRSLEFALISLFMASRLILYFPEGIAGYVEEKCVLKYRQKLESSQIV